MIIRDGHIERWYDVHQSTVFTRTILDGLSRPHHPLIGAKDIISNTGIPAPALAISWRDGHECLLQSPVLAMHDSARLVVPRGRAQRLPKQAWAIAIAV
jgi:hypothetical protein